MKTTVDILKDAKLAEREMRGVGSDKINEALRLMAEELLSALSEFPALIPRGLMTMGPALDDAELLRPYFRETRKLYDSLYSRFEKNGEPILSMGMSDSYRVAIEEGSTLVRVGRRLFIK